MGIINIIIFPHVLEKNSTKLAYFNGLGVMCSIYLLIVLICQMPEYMNEYFNYEDIKWVRFNFSTL